MSIHLVHGRYVPLLRSLSGRVPPSRVVWWDESFGLPRYDRSLRYLAGLNDNLSEIIPTAPHSIFNCRVWQIICLRPEDRFAPSGVHGPNDSCKCDRVENPTYHSEKKAAPGAASSRYRSAQGCTILIGLKEVTEKLPLAPTSLSSIPPNVTALYPFTKHLKPPRATEKFPVAPFSAPPTIAQ